MTESEFVNTKHFYSLGFVPLLNVSRGGRYTHLCKAIAHDNKEYDIFVDDQYNFFCYPVNKPLKGVYML